MCKTLSHFRPLEDPNCLVCDHSILKDHGHIRTYSCSKKVILDLEDCWFFRPRGILELKKKIKKYKRYKNS